MSFVSGINVKFTKVFHICFEQNIPFVAYLLPGSNDLIIAIQYKSLPRKINLSELPKCKGFIVAPFDLYNHLPVWLLEPDMLLNAEVSDEQLSALRNVELFRNMNKAQCTVLSTTKEQYTLKVSEGKKKIAGQSFEKYVLSRALVESVHEEFDPSLFLELVHKAYPNTLRYVLNIPGAGCWMGATPEPLVSVKDNNVEITSLAGTQKLSGNLVDDISWGTKELIEQRFVTNYIEESIKKFGETEYTIDGPHNFRAANVVHLKTVFNIRSRNIIAKLGDFVKEIHPTPSVCGLPKQAALAYIKSVENHSREYYSGFLGPVNLMEETQLFVNLRCMQWTAQHFVFYAGAGITAGSDPELEWEETNQKLVAMRSIIQQTKK
ncbi:MAG TPA: isochorismate synthase [Bacteroidales bacterium]|nr:isochorismate synthase [Bacteroidales bacterium]